MNKILKIIISIFGVVLVLWGLVFTIDYVRCSRFLEPVFVVAGQTADDGGSGIYYGLGYKVKIEKNISAEYGSELTSVEMYMFDKFITGAIANIHTTVDETINGGDITTQQIHNSFVGTVIEETTTYMIVEPNEDELERKSSDRIIINYGTDHIDYLYGIGRKVIINYTGYIMETYPAQINTDNILIFGYEDFEISVKKSEKVKKAKVLNDMDIHKYNSDVNLYYYGLEEVNVKVDNKTMSLEDALRSGKLTIDGLLIKANKDVTAGTIKSETYNDGGTTEWYYKDYTIIKCHSLDGNRDVYIGIPEMRLKDIN